MNIRSNKGRSILTMLGIIIGISSVILLISIGNSVKGQINEELNDMAGGQVYLYVSDRDSDGDYLSFTEDDFALIKEKIPHVVGVTPQWQYWGATVASRKGDTSVVIKAGNQYLEYASKDPFLHGGYFTQNDYDAGRDVCVITENGARQLFGTSNVVGMTLELTIFNVSREMTIVGVRKDSDSAMLNMLNGERIYLDMPLSVFANFGFYIGDMSDMLIIAESSEYSTDIAQRGIQLLEAKYNVRGENLIQVDDFNDYMSQMSSILNYITLFVAFVAAISLLVGGIGVMNIMLVSVTERTREIGIRKALGARKGVILQQFVIEAAVQSAMGGIIGIGLGSVATTAVGAAAGLEATPTPSAVIVSFSVSVAIGLFFGYAPARRAAALNPIDALRSE